MKNSNDFLKETSSLEMSLTQCHSVILCSIFICSKEQASVFCCLDSRLNTNSPKLVRSQRSYTSRILPLVRELLHTQNRGLAGKRRKVTNNLLKTQNIHQYLKELC